MGFWGKLLGGKFDAYPGAYNAVLAEHALSVMSAPDRKTVLDAVTPTVLSGANGAPMPLVMEMFADAGRPAQLNFVALAMSSLKMVPRLPKELWFEIANPFVSCADSPAFREKITQIAGQLERKHGEKIVVAQRSLDLGPGGVLARHATEEELNTVVISFVSRRPHLANGDITAKADAIYLRLLASPEGQNCTLAMAVEFAFRRASGEI